MAPMRVITTDNTVAKIGRSIKKREIMAIPPCLSGSQMASET
jgi:hypothetical protein